MKRLLSLFIILLLVGCSSEESTPSDPTDQGPNNILTGSWAYTYSVTNQRTDNFELNAAGGVMTGYFTNSQYGDYLTLWGEYTETEIGFVSSNVDANRRYFLDGTYTNNTMSGVIQMKTMAGELIREFEFSAIKQ